MYTFLLLWKSVSIKSSQISSLLSTQNIRHITSITENWSSEISSFCVCVKILTFVSIRGLQRVPGKCALWEKKNHAWLSNSFYTKVNFSFNSIFFPQDIYNFFFTNWFFICEIERSKKTGFTELLKNEVTSYYLKSRVTDTEATQKNLSSAGSFPKWPESNQIWAGSNKGAMILLLVSHMVTSAQALRSSSTAFLGHHPGAGLEVE